MTPTVVAVLAALLALVGLCGIVVPVLPGSICVGLAALCWALWGGSSWGWWAFAACAVLVCAGMGSSALLTRRDLGRREIPRWPLLVALLCAVVAGFLLPVVGLPVGFVVGLFCAELVRVRDLGQAGRTSLVALRAIGTGMLLELVCALVACAVLGTSMATALR